MMVSPRSTVSNANSLFSKTCDSLNDLVSTDTSYTSGNMYDASQKHWKQASPSSKKQTRKTDSWYFDGPSKLIKVSASQKNFPEINEEPSDDEVLGQRTFIGITSGFTDDDDDFDDDDDDDDDFEFVTKASHKSPKNAIAEDFFTPLPIQTSQRQEQVRNEIPLKPISKDAPLPYNINQRLTQSFDYNKQPQSFAEIYDVDSVTTNTQASDFYIGQQFISKSSLTPSNEIKSVISLSRFKKPLNQHQRSNSRTDAVEATETTPSPYSSQSSLRRKLSRHLLTKTSSNPTYQNDAASIVSYNTYNNTSRSSGTHGYAPSITSFAPTVSSKSSAVSAPLSAKTTLAKKSALSKRSSKYNKTGFANIFITKKDIENQKRKLTLLTISDVGSALESDVDDTNIIDDTASTVNNRSVRKVEYINQSSSLGSSRKKSFGRFFKR